jgi:glycosyltransferase involved in cell wall biosynthesis
MLENRDIIMICSDWNRHPGSTQHIAELLAKRNRVLWVSGIPLRAPRLSGRDVRRVLEKGRKMILSQVNSYDHTLPVVELHPLFLPFYDIPVILRLNDYLLRSTLMKKIRELRFQDYTILSSTPMVAGIIGTMGELSSHYLCMDDYGGNKDSFRILDQLERKMLERVDSTFAMSDYLMKNRVPKTGEINFFPEGVDLNHFKPKGGPVPASLSNVKKPIVGYAGLLEWWVDYELIVKCARAYPHATFVILGAAKVDISILQSERNVLCLGHIPYKELPQYYELFDVGLIPRKINRLTVAMNPLKLLEYLAMGMPVVSTNLPEVRKLGTLAYVADDHDQFVRMVGEALGDTAVEKKQVRRAQAERFSWQSVADRMSEVIQDIERRRHEVGNLSKVHG